MVEDNEAAPLALAAEQYATVHKYAGAFLQTLTFQSARRHDPLLSAVSLLRRLYAEKRRALPDRVPITHLSQADRRLIFEQGSGSARPALICRRLGRRQPILPADRRASHAQGDINQNEGVGSPWTGRSGRCRPVACQSASDAIVPISRRRALRQARLMQLFKIDSTIADATELSATHLTPAERASLGGPGRRDHRQH